MANTLNNKFGGWVFHKRVDLDSATPWYHIDKAHPKIIKTWLKQRR